MVSDLLAADVVYDLQPLQASGSSLVSVIPVYHLVKPAHPCPELKTIFDARWLNDTLPVVSEPFCCYHFDALWSVLHWYHRARRTPVFSKHDWRKFYQSLLPGRTLRAGGRLHGRLVQFSTDRCVFGRSTEPAIGQAVNHTLWREAWPAAHLGPSPVHALQILDDTLAVSDDVPALRTHFGRFRALGNFHGLLDATEKLEIEKPAVVFCGKAVSARGISHPPLLWAGACLQLLAMADRCSSKKGLQILLGNLN